jgi:hypothetical protein
MPTIVVGGKFDAGAGWVDALRPGVAPGLPGDVPGRRFTPGWPVNLTPKAPAVNIHSVFYHNCYYIKRF